MLIILSNILSTHKLKASKGSQLFTFPFHHSQTNLKIYSIIQDVISIFSSVYCIRFFLNLRQLYFSLSIHSSSTSCFRFRFVFLFLASCFDSFFFFLFDCDFSIYLNVELAGHGATVFSDFFFLLLCICDNMLIPIWKWKNLARN